MTLAIDAAQELAILAAAFQEFEELRASEGARLHARAGAVSGWSAAQHLYHVALATDLALRNVRALANDDGARLVPADGPPSELARAVLSGGGPGRGATQAPRMVRPGEVVDPGFLADELARGRATVRELEQALAAIAAAPRRIPHQELGPLSALEWLRFARLHARHHGAIAAEVLAALE